MSLFDWRVAKRQIQSGYNFGYDAAIEHYANLKRKMFDQIAVNQSLINGNYYEEVEKLLQQELSELYDGTSQSLSSLSYKSLSTIQQMVKDVFDGTDSGILTSLASELNNLENNIDIIHNFMNATFDGNSDVGKRHQRRIDLIDKYQE